MKGQVMRRRLQIVAAGVLVLSVCGKTSRAQGEERRFLDLTQVAAEGNAVQDFVPRGWEIEEQITGDLNGDARPDTVVTLIEDVPAETADGGLTDRYRALLVLADGGSGKLRRVAAATRLLRCTGCGGVLNNSGASSVTIAKGVLIVNNFWGSRESVDLTQRFRYDPRLKRFVLIGEDSERRDRAVGTSVSTSSNYLTGVETHKQTRYDQKKDRDVLVSSTTKRIRTSKRFLEDIDYDE
jgi:hypothetical protein